MLPKNPVFSNTALEKAFIPAVIVLVGFCAFGLGRLSALEAQKGELKVYEPPAAAAPEAAALGAAAAASAHSEGRYVASKNGERYYLPSCSGAGRIKEENKVWFPSAQAAQSAGFTPAANCPGL